jgi:SAM-dependent methyltransferase
VTSAFVYSGAELALFAGATNWKSYLARQVRPFLGPRVLEVGAGIGGTTEALCAGEQTQWLCLEPDPEQAGRLAESLSGQRATLGCAVRAATVSELAPAEQFDTILYVDVLEHIEDDAGELRESARHLAPGGHLVVLSPAHQFLFTPFDRAIGHHRRYSRATLLALAPEELPLMTCRYLDSAGLLASLGNRLILSAAMPTAAQIAFWDRILVRASSRLDPVLGYRWGKSILAVWRRGS